MSEVYKHAYVIGKTLPKRERFGLWSKIEDGLLSCLSLSIEAAFGKPEEKVRPLRELRVRLDVVKRLIRLAQELGVIDEKKYFRLQEHVVESSKMAAGWMGYVERKEPARKRDSFS